MKRIIFTIMAVFALHASIFTIRDSSAADLPAPVPKSGQTTCYDTSGNIIGCANTGQDGETQTGVDWPFPRFTDNGNGTAKDNLTGLIWLKNADCYGRQNWIDAVAAPRTLQTGQCGLTDGSTAGQWRLPTVKELKSLSDITNYLPSLPTGHPFNNVQPDSYWSSTHDAVSATKAWFVEMTAGVSYPSDYDDTVFFNNPRVWPVRSGTEETAPAPVAKTGQTVSFVAGDDGDLKPGVTWPVPRFTDNNNGTVTDNLTGLVWLKKVECIGPQTWANALTAANTLADSACGLSDGSEVGYWRLPNEKEILSLIDYNNNRAALPDGQPFSPGLTIAASFWSSNTFGGYTYTAMEVSIDSGYTSYMDKTFESWVWPVRAVLPVVSPSTALYQPTTSGSSSFEIGWQASTTADVTYVIEESTDGGTTYNQISIQTGNLLALSGKTNGTYQYRVKAAKAGYTSSAWRTSQPITVALTCPAIGQIYQPTSSGNGSFEIGWSGSPISPVTYVIEESTNGGSVWNTFRSQSSNLLSVTGKANGNYMYRVKVQKGGYAESGWSTSKAISVAPTCPTISQIYQPTSSGNGSFEIGWGASPASPVTYVIEENINGAGWNAFRSQSSNLLSVTGKANGSYMYRIKVQKGGYAESGWRTSQAITVTTTCPAIGQIYQPTSSGNGSFEIGWSGSPVSPVTYVIEESTNGGTVWNAFRSQSSNLLSVTGKANGNYMYRIKVQKGGYAESGWRTSKALSVTLTTGAPGQLYTPVTAKPTFDIGWQHSPQNPVTYIVEESYNSGGYVQVASQASNLLTLTGKAPGAYRYRVKAQKGGGWLESGYRTSGIINVVP